MKDHLISHTGYKPFQCPHCKKFYRRKEILKNHIIIHSKESYFKNNPDKFQEMMNEVKQMKHIKHNFDDLETCNKKNDTNISCSSSISKEETKQNNISTVKSTQSTSCNNLENKGKKIEKKNIFVKNKKENVEKNLLYFNRANDECILNDKLFKTNYCHVWPNELNNLLYSTVDISIKEDNNPNIEQNNFNFEKKKFILKKAENEGDTIKPAKPNNLFLIFYDNNNADSKNKCENDECSNMTNLYLNEYEQKKNVYDFVNNF